MRDTIVAPATAPGKAGVAIIRVSGPLACETMQWLGVSKIKPRQASYACLKDSVTDDVIDEALILWFKGPHSFTGEDVVEYHVHGSQAVIRRVLDVILDKKGIRLAEAGEFAKRAFLNGKMDLTKAEGLADLIDAETELQRKQALKQMQGSLQKQVDNWRQQLIEMQALTEAYIDFPDEEIPPEIITDMKRKCKDLSQSLGRHLHDKHCGERIREGVHIAIIGLPNVGKSSLLNALAKRDVAIVSQIAGTTRDILEVHLDLGGYPVTLLDMAGLRDNTDDIIEQEGIKRAKDAARRADIHIGIIDASQDLKPQLDTLKAVQKEDGLLVLNKIDLLDDTQLTILRDKLLKAVPSALVSISASNNKGLDRLLEILNKHIHDSFHASEAPIITRQRHRHALQQVYDILGQVDLEKPIELVAEDFRSAASELGKITGKIDVEQILDHIFSQFCIGK